ncbi:MAG: hypothetical protein JW839_04530 [Candidatus Lokiarchaeota archaeon]|nr:hypothetical protein [Candidatus Lokiarchaeota archaeon]
MARVENKNPTHLKMKLEETRKRIEELRGLVNAHKKKGSIKELSDTYAFQLDQAEREEEAILLELQGGPLSDEFTIMARSESEERKEPRSKTDYRINNVVATAQLKINEGDKIDLSKAARAIETAEYVPDDFPAMTVQMVDPPCTVLVFDNAKIVMSGLKDPKAVDTVPTATVRELKKAGLDVEQGGGATITNVVAGGEFGFEVDLEAVSECIANAVYDTEVFPGLTLYHQDAVTFLIFKNGKFVCTGATVEADIERSITDVSKMIKEYDYAK